MRERQRGSGAWRRGIGRSTGRGGAEGPGKGTCWHQRQQQGGDANQYNKIFEANRPLLKDADDIFYHNLLGAGVNKAKALSMYYAVRLFGGSHWS